MTKLAGLIVAITLLAAAPTLATATEYYPITTGPWIPSKPAAQALSKQDTPRVAITTGPWVSSKPGARVNVPDTQPVVITTGPWIPSKPSARATGPR